MKVKGKHEETVEEVCDILNGISHQSSASSFETVNGSNSYDYMQQEVAEIDKQT